MTKLLEYFEDQAYFLLFGVATACVTAGVYELNAPARKQKTYEIIDIQFEKEYEEARRLKDKREADDAALISQHNKNREIWGVSRICDYPITYELDFVDRDTNRPFTVKYTETIK